MFFSGSKKTTEALIKRVAELEQKNRDLELENRHLEELHSHSPLAYQSLDAQGRFLDINQTWLDMLGYERDEVIGRNYSDFLHEKSAALYNQRFSCFKQQGAVSDAEFELYRKDGTLLTILLDGRIVATEDGGFLRTACVLKDISSLKELNKKYQRTNAIMQFVMDAMSSFVFWKDSDCVYLGCNKNFARASGVGSPEEIVGKTDHDLTWNKEDADWFVTFDRMIMAEDKASYNVVKTQRFADGKEAWISSNNAPIYDGQGNVSGVVGYYDDITERLDAEKNLQDSEERFRLLSEASPTGIYLVQGSRFTYVNQALADMFGYEIDEILAMPSALEIVHGDDRDQVKEYAKGRLEGRQDSVHYSFRGVKKGGTEISIEVHGRRIDYQGRPGIIGSLLNNTEKELAQAQLRQAQKLEAVGRLSGGVAHDINNLLTPILGFSELMMLNPDLPDKERTMLMQMIHAAHRAQELIAQLLAFSRKQILKTEPIDLNQTIDEYYPLIQRTLRENIDIVVKKGEGMSLVLADRGQIEQVLMNLVVNASDAMPEGGTLVIETAMRELGEAEITTHPDVEPGRYAVFSISDSGKGMDKETVARIFEPFYSTKGDEGTGLGLATVYGIIQQHNGTIWVYSELGQGTIFKVFLPVTDQVQKEQQSHKKSADLGGSETILVAEDDDIVRRTVCAILAQEQYQVVEVENGVAALAAVEAGCVPDLLLTDVVMPDMNGKAVYTEIKKMIPSLNVLYMSGYTDDIIAQQGNLEEGVHFIQKPFGARAALEKIRSILDS